MLEGIKHMLFYKENGQWYEEVPNVKVHETELPPSIRKKIRQMNQDDSTINFCPHCGAKVRIAGAKFCSSCGKSLNN